ncbi:hypothetical protein J3R83DRAFT_8681 [Lanmaoa asiatica]|nr:hypothetical protein J3R83DRAFT_8681 [Lanmaoa asiatica]
MGVVAFGTRSRNNYMQPVERYKLQRPSPKRLPSLLLVALLFDPYSHHLSFLPCALPSQEMGRRKIEIQPITHERNRSVTFLKRKNGLFKKAYELGVLCSVDVAVIIFGLSFPLFIRSSHLHIPEERASHHLKLYQYCSGDIHDIVQRHIRYDGEKDTRTPRDFANNANAKLDDAGDGDDDDVDDDDPDSNPRSGNKKRTDAKLKQEYNNGKLIPPGGDLGLNVDMNDYPLHRPMTIPQPPMPLHHSTQLPAGGASSLPISTERHTSSGRLIPTNNQLSSQKKPRLAPNVSAGSNPKLTPDDSMYNGYLPSPTSAHPPNNYRQNGQTSHQLPYSYLGVAASSPQQPFLSSSSYDFPSSSRGAPIPRTAGYNQRSSTAYPQPQDAQVQGIYHQLMRHNLPSGQAPNGSNARSQQSPDLLAAFLDNGDDHRPPPTQPPQFAPLDWPAHASSQQHPQAPPPPQQESGRYPSISHRYATQSFTGHSGETSWLDFLSHSAPQPGGQQLHMTLPPANGRDGLSWERDRDMEHYSPSERGGGNIDKGMTNGTGLISPPSRKRPRTDSVADDSRRPSPIMRGKAGVGQDSLDPNGDAHRPGIKEE